MFKIKFKRRLKIKSMSQPDLVWRWLIAIFLILVVSALAGGYYFYQKFESLEVISQRRLQGQNVEPARLDLKALAEVRARLDAKALRDEIIKNSTSTIILDPSL